MIALRFVQDLAHNGLSGIGLGICHILLSNLSLPAGTPIPASTLQLSALAPSQKHLFEPTPEPDKEIPRGHPPVLTLILACRSGSKAQIAKQVILRRHEKDLAQRRKRKGIAERQGWREGLEIVWEVVDLDTVGGKNGILAFCNRLKES